MQEQKITGEDGERVEGRKERAFAGRKEGKANHKRAGRKLYGRRRKRRGGVGER